MAQLRYEVGLLRDTAKYAYRTGSIATTGQSERIAWQKARPETLTEGRALAVTQWWSSRRLPRERHGLVRPEAKRAILVKCQIPAVGDQRAAARDRVCRQRRDIFAREVAGQQS